MNKKTTALWALLAVAVCAGATETSPGDPIVQEARIAYASQPDYPPLDLRFRHDGRVVVSLQVFADGSAHNIEISESSGWQGLDDAAIRTVATSWGFSPATTRSGVPVVSSKQVAVRFQLDPPVQPSTDLSIPQQVGLVLISYFTFQHSSNAVLDACTRRGVDTAAARAQWTAGNGATAEKVAAFQRYLDGKKGQIPDYTQNAMPMAQQYELHIKLEDLRSGDAAKAQTRCQRVVESFKQGKETFERFDPESYQNLSKIKL